MWKKSDYVQDDEKVQISIYQPGLEAPHVDVRIDGKENSLGIWYKNHQHGPVWSCLLYDAVVEGKCQWEVTPFKIQVTVLKKVRGQHWPSMLRQEKTPPLQQQNAAAAAQDKWAAVASEHEKEEAEQKKDLDALLREVYAKSDPDSRKAINRSFSESGGTHFITNWREVEKMTFPRPSPPSSS